MSRPFVCVDLSQASRDFQPVALGPGMPTLDRSKANYRILRGWLRDLVAEPETGVDHQSVAFRIPPGFDQNQADGSPEARPVVESCLPITPRDLRGPLGRQLEDLRERIEKVAPRSETERALAAFLREARSTQLDPANLYPGCHLFKYRGVDGSWRLVWCWGYRRKGEWPGEPVIHDGSLIFKLPNERLAISKEPVSRSSGRGAGRKVATVMVALVLLAVIGVGSWWTYHKWSKTAGPEESTSTRPAEPALVVTPESWSGPAGGRIPFAIQRRDESGKLVNVGGQVVGLADDPRVVIFEPMATTATAVSPGRTMVRFQLGSLSAQASVTVRPAENPDSLAIEPADVPLAIGTTARLKLVGTYKDGTKVDLTEQAAWDSLKPDALFCYRGRLEGLTQGTATIQARYHATTDGPNVEARASIAVASTKSKAIEISVDPTPIIVGRPATLGAFALNAEGVKFPLNQSSRLKWELDSNQASLPDSEHLVADRPGRFKLKGTFDDLSATIEVDAIDEPSASGDLAKLAVRPSSPMLAVGEVVRLELTPAEGGQAVFTSANPETAEVDASGRLVGRAPGRAKVRVSRGGQETEVEATVEDTAFESTAIVPDRLQVEVGASLPVRVIGRAKGGREIDLAAEFLTWETLPSSEFASYDPATSHLRGLAPTTESPQTLTVRLGDLRASGRVEVVAAPFLLEVLPAGPVDLPVGQSARLRVWACFGDGRKVEAKGQALAWEASSADGLTFRDGIANAATAGEIPIKVRASYQGRRSEEVVIRAVPASADITLAVVVPRPVLIVGESGLMALSGSDGQGAVELASDAGRFESGDPSVLAVDPASGAYRALKAGEVEVKATHPAAPSPAVARLRVVASDQVTLAFVPDEVEAVVGTITTIKPVLVVAGSDAPTPLEASAQVVYTIGEPDAVDWDPPNLIGRVPSGPFEVTATTLGLTARARVRVIEAGGSPGSVGEAPTLRAVPEKVALAPGQSVSPRIEQKGPGSVEDWREVPPEAITWTVPAGVRWVPPAKGLAPSATLDRGAPESRLEAEYQGRKTSLILTSGPTPLASSRPGKPTIRRDPDTGTLIVGRSQRFSVVLEEAKTSRPVLDARWMPDFEDEFVRWKAPVLTAKKVGRNLRLTVDVNGRTLVANAMIVPEDSAESDRARLPARSSAKADGPKPAVKSTAAANPGASRGGAGKPLPGPYPKAWGNLSKADLRRPVKVNGKCVPFGNLTPSQCSKLDPKQPVPFLKPDRITIETDGPTPLRLPVDTAFDAYRVIAHIKEGEPFDVTESATLAPKADTSGSAVAIREGRIVSIRPGRAVVQARYLGLTTESGIPVEVTGEQTVDAIEIEPDALAIELGNSAKLRATGFVGGRPVGDITDWARLVWKSRDPEFVRADGPTVTGLARTAEAGVTAQIGPIISKVARVTVNVSTGRPRPVVDSPSAAAVEVMTVGETRPLADLDVFAPGSGRAIPDGPEVRVSDPGILAFDGSGSLTALAPGRAEIAFATGSGGSLRVPFEVRPADPLVGKVEIVIEPSSDALAVGESRAIRVYQVDESGERVNRTGDAELVVVGDAVKADGGEVQGVKPGRAEVQASLPGVDPGRVGKATFIVNDEPFTALEVNPSPLTLALGEAVNLRVAAIGKGRRVELGDHPDLKITVPDAGSSVVELGGERQVVGVLPGRANLRVAWRNKLEVIVPVTVTAEVAGSLILRPIKGLVEVGQDLAYSVSAERAGQVVPVGPEDGLLLEVARSGVARLDRGMVVRGVSPGSTEVVARLGDLRATGTLTVFEGPHGSKVEAATAGSLQFRPATLGLAMGTAGQPFAVFQTREDGSSEDVTTRASIVVAGSNGVVEVRKTESGAILRPLAPGRAEVVASLGSLKLAGPLIARVVQSDRGLARLETTPRALTVRVGESAAFRSIKVIPAPGEPGVEVAYHVDPTGVDLVSVADGRSIRGLKPGQARVKLKVVAPGEKYDGLEGLATVAVVSAPGSTASEGTEPSTSPTTTPVASNLFRSVRSLRTVEHTGHLFSVEIEVRADRSAGEPEYRVIEASTDPAGWTASRPDGDGSKVVLQSPKLAFRAGSVYELTIEARRKPGDRVERQPYTFRVGVEIRPEQGDTPGASPR